MRCFTVCKIIQHAQHCCVVPSVFMVLLAQRRTTVPSVVFYHELNSDVIVVLYQYSTLIIRQ